MLLKSHALFDIILGSLTGQAVIYDMSSNVVTITSVNVAANSVKLTWPAVIKDIQSVYVVEARAPSISHIWKVHAAGLFATSCIVKGLDLHDFNYEFRVRTKSSSELGEPTKSASTAAFRPPGDRTTPAMHRLSSKQSSKIPLSDSNPAQPPYRHASTLRPRAKLSAKPYVRSYSGPYHHQRQANALP